MRLIDADELIEHLRKDPLFEFVERYGIISVIESRPTIEPETLDVDKHIEMLGREYVAQDIENSKGFIVGHSIREPITRCKDCEYNGLVECPHGAGLFTDPYDFCKFGKKKEASECF